MSIWTSVNAGVRQASILGPIWFLIFINDIFDNFSSNIKLFIDDTFLFSVILDITASAREWRLEKNQRWENWQKTWKKKISDWPFHWKMILIQMLKRAQEVICSRKIKKNPTYSPRVFSNAIVSEINSQKHLGVALDSKLTNNHLLRNVVKWSDTL